MSKTSPQLNSNESAFFENTTSSMLTASRLLFDDNSLCVSNNSLTESNKPHFPTNPSNLYQSPFNNQSTENNSDAFAIWNNNSSNQMNSPFNCEPNAMNTLLTWNPIFNQKSYFSNSTQFIDDPFPQNGTIGEAGLGTEIVGMSGFTIPSTQTSFQKFNHPASNNMPILNRRESFDFISPNDQTISFSYHDNSQSGHPSNDIYQINNMIVPMSTPILTQTNSNMTFNTNVEGDLNTFPKSWLIENFMRVNDDCTIARSLLYSYYLYTCHHLGETPVNSAGLGKVIRSVFGRIKNRRLGARGDSRYHYLELKIKPDSNLLHLPLEEVNRIASFYKTNTSNEKGSKINDKQTDSSGETQEQSQEEILKIKLENKKILEFQSKPISFFLQPFLRFSKFNIKITPSTLDEQSTSNVQYYWNIFDQIKASFDALEGHVITCFRTLDDRKLNHFIFKFWIEDSGSNNFRTNESEVTSLRSLLKDQHIRKYIRYYHQTFFTFLLDSLVGDVIQYHSVVYIQHVIDMFTVFDNVMTQLFHPFPFSTEFYNDMSTVLADAMRILVDYKNMQILKIDLYSKLILCESELAKFISLLQDSKEKVFNNEFHQSFKLFIDHSTNVDFLLEKFQMFLISILSGSCDENLTLVRQEIVAILNNNSAISSCIDFAKYWLVFINLLVNNSPDTCKISNELALIGNYYFHFMTVIITNQIQNNCLKKYTKKSKNS